MKLDQLLAKLKFTKMYRSPFFKKEEEQDIKIKEKNEGKFTDWIKDNMPGKSTCEAATAVMKNKDKYTTRVMKMANFAKNFACKKK